MKIIAPPPQRFFKKLATLIMIAALSLSCVVKVKPTPYQRGLKAYYGALLSKSTQEELRLALTGLERELKLAPADVGLLSLRASTNLELLRLDVQGGGTNFSSQAALLLRDLRLLQSLIDQNGNQPPWVGARIYTMTGDVMMLRAIALGNSADICANLQASGLFRLAADYYLHAGSVARSTEAALKGKEQESLNLPAVLKEQANARDGYINGLGGLAQRPVTLKSM